MQLFYAQNISEETYQFPEDESKHLIRVLRKQLNDSIFVTDGKGNLFETLLIDDHPKRATIQITKTTTCPRNDKYIHVAIAPTKNNDRIEWFLEKATEIGITELSLIICDNSERTKLKLDRLHKVAVSAMKQSNQFYLPKINAPVSFSEFITQKNDQTKLIAHCEDEQKHSIQSIASLNDICMLIGPEGDFSKTEIELALKHQFIPVTLGETRLRTETAGVVAVTLLNNM